MPRAPPPSSEPSVGGHRFWLPTLQPLASAAPAHPLSGDANTRRPHRGQGTGSSAASPPEAACPGAGGVGSGRNPGHIASGCPAKKQLPPPLPDGSGADRRDCC